LSWQPCAWHCHSHPRWPAPGRVADLRKPSGFLFANNGGDVPAREKSLENGRCFLLHSPRGRVIFELSPGKPETRTEYHTRRSYVRLIEPTNEFTAATTNSAAT
jgi:hypothetical protein